MSEIWNNENGALKNFKPLEKIWTNLCNFIFEHTYVHLFCLKIIIIIIVIIIVFRNIPLFLLSISVSTLSLSLFLMLILSEFSCLRTRVMFELRTLKSSVTQSTRKLRERSSKGALKQFSLTVNDPQFGGRRAVSPRVAWSTSWRAEADCFQMNNLLIEKGWKENEVIVVENCFHFSRVLLMMMGCVRRMHVFAPTHPLKNGS